MIAIGVFFQVNAHAGVDSRFQTMPGLAFPLTAEAERALVAFKNGAFNYVHLVSLKMFWFKHCYNPLVHH